MKIVTAVQMVPDLVEDLVIDPGGKSLDAFSIRWVINEFDDFAIEQAILLKERYGGKVTIVAPGMDGADDALFNAAAKGADELIKLSADFENETNTHGFARVFAPVISKLGPDLILTGVQVHHRSDGCLGSMLAEELGLPYVGYVSGVTLEGGKMIVKKEYPGGVIAEMEVALPAVVGIQSSDTPPRYVPISKVRQVMKTSKIREEEAGDMELKGECAIDKMYLPQISGQVTMLAGSVEDVAKQMASIFKEAGVL